MSNHGIHRPPSADATELDSGSDSESSLIARGLRTSTEIREHDRGIIDDEEEAEQLLSARNEPSTIRKYFTRGEDDRDRVKNERRKQQRYEKQTKRAAKLAAKKDKRRLSRSGKEEESELMYEMEEGGPKDSSDSSDNSSEIDRLRLEDTHIQRKHARTSRMSRMCGLHVVILVAFLGVLYGAFRVSKHGSKPNLQMDLRTLFNGTSKFAPTTILISLDGFRADFLQRNLTPSLKSFIQSGVSPRYMLPSFPSVTFPNHFTLVTGLYPEAHGVVGNSFWDPALQEEFFYTDPARSMQPKWWQGEPIWFTAEKQGFRTAIHMWPGSEAHIGDIEPAYLDKYNGKEALPNKVDRILGLLDLPGAEDLGATDEMPRPQLIAAYVPNVDSAGHLYGPNSTEIRTIISDADNMLGLLFAGLEERNLTDIVNIIVVSDHGMATTDASRLIQLDDIIDMSKIEHTDGWPHYGLRPYDEADLSSLYSQLKVESLQSKNFEVYLRDVDMPERYHFSQNERIAPLWIFPKTGWAIVTKDQYDIAKDRPQGKIYHPRGIHGYDHEHPLMRAIFIARGPAFPHTPGSRVEVFQNTEVYNLVCDSIGIVPHPNNGTLRLPLKPVGLHEDFPLDNVPEDPEQMPEPAPGPKTETEVQTEHQTTSEQQAQSVSAENKALSTTTAVEENKDSADDSPTKTESDPAIATRPVVQDGASQDEVDTNVNHWWDWVNGKLGGVKDWAIGVWDDVENKVDEVKDKVGDKFGGKSDGEGTGS